MKPLTLSLVALGALAYMWLIIYGFARAIDLHLTQLVR